MSFEHSFEMPNEILVNGEWIDCGTITCFVEAEPDETLGDTDWYVSACGIEGRLINDMITSRPRAKDTSVHWLPASHPLYHTIKRYAYKHEATALEELWHKWLNDRPRSYRRSMSG